MKKTGYYFSEVDECNFCGNKTILNRILGQRLNKSQGNNPKNKSGISVSIIKCRTCSLIYSNPQPIPMNIQDHYGIVAEDYWTESYFINDPSYFSSQISSAKNLIPFQNGMKALDIGAGIGKCMIALENSGFDTFGIEPSLTFRDKAISKMNINPERLQLGMLDDADFEKSSFDFITFGAVLEHLYNPAESIQKALSWLKPNGIIQIEVPSSRWLISDIFNLYFKLRGTNYVTNLSPMHNPFHLYEFDIKSFKKLGKRLSFEIIEFEHYVCKIYFIPTFLHPILKWYMSKTGKGMQLNVWLRKSTM